MSVWRKKNFGLMQSAIARKVAVPLFLSACGAFVALFVFYWFLSRTAGDAPFVSAAGRQRMLSQQMLAYAVMVRIGQEDDRQGLRDLVASFDRALDALERGGQVGEDYVRPAPPEVLDDIAAVRRLWTELRDPLLVVANEPVNTSRARQASTAVESTIPSLTDASNKVVVAYGAWSQKLRRRTLLVLLAVAGFDLALLFASLELIKRGLVRPIQLLDEAARRITEGNFDIPVAVTTRDELATLARTFNEMSARIGRLLKDLGESEERYRDLFEHANDLIQSVAPDGSFLYVNQAWRAALGYTEQEVASLSVLDVVHPDSKVHCMELFQRVMAGDAIPRVEVTFVTKDGRAIVAEGSVNCSIKNGRPVATRAIFRDVTERNRAEEEIEKASKLRSDFVSFVTHQLRTPLAGIKWMLELAAQESGAPLELQSYISDARESAERLIRLVNDLLDASRLEGGRLSMVLRETQLGPLTQSVIDELAGLIQEKEHRLSVAGGEDRMPVLVDPQMLRQAILNLISNAVKYTPPGGEIAIRMNHSDGLMHWAICDSGIGIPQSVQHRLFEKFYRAENASAMETEGTGLGLYLVRLIVERLGGRVSCESDEGKGATFEFTLPGAR